MEKHYFTKNVEKMVDPIDVGTIHFMQQYVKPIPVSLQNKMINKGAKKNTHMGFVVEPYSFFLCYEIVDVAKAQALLPDNYELLKTKIFESDEPNYYCIFGSFNVHTSAFWGTRMEFYVIARNKETNLLSWVIIDYHTNTVSFDERYGLTGRNTTECILTTNFAGEIIIDIRGINDGRQLVVDGKIDQGVKLALDQRLWLEGNLSVAYGREIAQPYSKAFAVAFDSLEVASAYKLASNDINIRKNTWYPSLFKDEPTHIVMFPFAQHFLSDSPGYSSGITTKEGLDNFVNNLDFSNVPSYSSKKIRTIFKISQGISLLIIAILTILLIIK